MFRQHGPVRGHQRVVALRDRFEEWKQDGPGANGQMDQGPSYKSIRNMKLMHTALWIGGMARGVALGSPILAFAGWTASQWYRKDAAVAEYFRKGMARAKPEDIERFRRIVNEMADKVGLNDDERPKEIVVVEDELANAGAADFAVPKVVRKMDHGKVHRKVVRQNKGYIVAFSGLLRAMPDEELRAVVGHEMTHWKHADSMKGTALHYGLRVVSAFRGFIPFAAAWAALGGVNFSFAPSVVWKGIEASLDAVATPKYGIMVGATVAAWTLRSTAQRAMEYRADRGGAKLEGAKVMASSLRKLDIHNNQVDTGTGFINKCVNKLYGNSFRKGPNPLQRIALTVFCDHPATYDRIKRLNKMEAPAQKQAAALAG